jgi:hypothetical protein
MGKYILQRRKRNEGMLSVPVSHGRLSMRCCYTHGERYLIADVIWKDTQRKRGVAVLDVPYVPLRVMDRKKKGKRIAL